MLFTISALVKGTLVLQLVLGMGHGYQVDMKRLSSQNVEAMQKLRDLMEKEELEVEPYMTENYSLAKWLHFYGFQVEATLDAIRRNVRWRAEEGIDGILTEDWSDMRQRFPYTLDTCDKEGRPIVYVDVEDWDIAGYLSAGKEAQDRFFRYAILWREEIEALVWEWCQAGKYVTQGTMIVNLAGFSPQKHACLSCLQLYRKVGLIVEPNYPNTRKNVVGVGTPLFFRAVHWALMPTTQNHLLLFGHDRSQWEAHLLENIDPDQMPRGLLEPPNPGDPQGSPTLKSSPPEPNKYPNYAAVQQGAPAPTETPYPFALPAPGMALPGYGRIWKREL